MQFFMADLKVGDEVRILCRHRRRGQAVPEGGHQGTVIKIGRRWATAVFEQEPWRDSRGNEHPVRSEVVFDLETGIIRANTEGFYIRTPRQLDRDERRKTALFVLAEHGIEVKLSYENSITLEQLEALAEVTRTWERQD